MKFARKQTRLVQRPEVGNLFHHAQRLFVPAGIGADLAGVLGINIAADTADDEPFVDLAHGRQDRFHRRVRTFQQIEYGPPRRARTEAGELGEGLNQIFDLLRCHGLVIRSSRINLPSRKCLSCTTWNRYRPRHVSHRSDN